MFETIFYTIVITSVIYSGMYLIFDLIYIIIESKKRRLYLEDVINYMFDNHSETEQIFWIRFTAKYGVIAPELLYKYKQYKQQNDNKKNKNH